MLLYFAAVCVATYAIVVTFGIRTKLFKQFRKLKKMQMQNNCQNQEPVTLPGRKVPLLHKLISYLLLHCNSLRFWSSIKVGCVEKHMKVT